MHFELNSTQMELELLRNDKDYLVGQSVDFITNNYESMPNGFITFMEDEDVPELLFRMIGKVMLTKRMSSQALIGMMFNKVKRYADYKTIVNIMLNAVAENDLVEIKYKGAYIYFDSAMKLPKDIAKKHHQLTYVLPSPTPPMLIEDNHSIGYRHIKESIICGGSLKHHNKRLNLKHINRLNSTPYRMENRIPFLVQPVFDDEPKMKDNGQMETEKDVSKRFASFNTIVEQLPHVRNELHKMGNKFYIHHKFDNGGRTYAKAHHVNYQGMAYCKALVQSFTKQLVEQEW